MPPWETRPSWADLDARKALTALTKAGAGNHQRKHSWEITNPNHSTAGANRREPHAESLMSSYQERVTSTVSTCMDRIKNLKYRISYLKKPRGNKRLRLN